MDIKHKEKQVLADKYDQYGQMLYRLCYVMLGHAPDAEDALHDTFLRYICKHPRFQDTEHEKAWLIRVTVNICRDMLRRKSRQAKPDGNIEAAEAIANESTGVLACVLSLTPKLKSVIYLHYIAGYQVNEIARIMGITLSAVKMRLQRGRQALKIEYEEEEG